MLVIFIWQKCGHREYGEKGRVALETGAATLGELKRGAAVKERIKELKTEAAGLEAELLLKRTNGISVSSYGWSGTYYGSSEADQFEGYGRFEFDNGDRFEGIFSANEFWDGIY